MSHYPALDVPPQVADAFALGSVAFAIYAPRMMAKGLRQRREVQARRQETPVNAAPQAPAGMPPGVAVAPGPAPAMPQPAAPAKRSNVVDLSAMGLPTIIRGPSQ